MRLKPFSAVADQVTLNPWPSGTAATWHPFVIRLLGELRVTFVAQTGQTAEQVAKERTDVVAIIAPELIPAQGVCTKIATVSELCRPGKTRLVVGLKAFGQEKKGAKRHEGVISRLWDNGTVEIGTITGAMTFEAALISVPKGAHSNLKSQTKAKR